MMSDVEPIPSSAIPTNEELIAKIQCTFTSLPMIQMLITRRQATLTKLQLRKKKYPSHVVIPLRYMPCRQLLTNKYSTIYISVEFAAAVSIMKFMMEEGIKVFTNMHMYWDGIQGIDLFELD